MRKLSDPPANDSLTDIELKTIVLVALGFSNDAIAKRFDVSEKAVGKRVNLISDKLQLFDPENVYHTRSRLVYECLRRGLITLEQLQEF